MTRVVLIRTADGPCAIAVGERDVRDPRIGEVLIRVYAAAVSLADVVMRRHARRVSVPVPFTPGMDAAGKVEAVGSDVTHVEDGQRVMAAVGTQRPEAGPRPSGSS